MATYDEMINKLSPEQVRQMFNQGFPSELPKSMTLLDYISPSSYRDPRAADRFAPQNSATQTVTPELDENGFRQLSYEEGQRVYKDPRHDPNLSANAQYDKLFGGNQAVAPVTNSMSMPSFNLSNLTNYIPSASTIGEYIPREIPNVFGVNNPLYAGLLGADQSQALSKQSNIAGLLGAAAALVQGMGRQGGRRSAAQNIISALGAGYGAAGQQYQQGLQMYGQTQQLGLQQRQQAAIQAMKLKYPEYADEIDANPSGAFRLIAEREAAGKKLITAKPGEVIFDPTGKQIAQVPAEVKEGKQEVFTGDYGNLALTMYGTARASELSDPQRQALGKRADQLGIGKPASTNLTVNTGELSKGTKGELEKTILSTGDAITRLNSIQASNRPEYQTPKFKGIQELSTFKDKYLTLSPEEKTTLTNFSKYRQNTTQNLNQTIKDMTGSAMGVQEADRIIATLPNAGTGIFDGDSPTQFQAKLDNAIQQTKYALARKNYSLLKGLKWENINLDDVPKIVNQRGKEIEKQYKLDPKDPATKKTVERQLAAEFGISF